MEEIYILFLIEYYYIVMLYYQNYQTMKKKQEEETKGTSEIMLKSNENTLREPVVIPSASFSLFDIFLVVFLLCFNSYTI